MFTCEICGHTFFDEPDVNFPTMCVSCAQVKKDSLSPKNVLDDWGSEDEIFVGRCSQCFVLVCVSEGAYVCPWCLSELIS